MRKHVVPKDALQVSFLTKVPSFLFEKLLVSVTEIANYGFPGPSFTLIKFICSFYVFRINL